VTGTCKREGDQRYGLREAKDSDTVAGITYRCIARAVERSVLLLYDVAHLTVFSGGAQEKREIKVDENRREKRAQ
jgi:hypothetical protein